MISGEQVTGGATFGYDGRGNLTSSVTTLGTSTYGYTSENLLKTNSGGISLYYDPAGRLIEYDTSISTRLMYDGGQIAAEIANPSGAITKRYVFGPGADEPLVEYDDSGAKTWLVADERGSIVARTDASGAATVRNSYDEYGIPASTNIGRFQYTGQAWLPELGLAYCKARIYSPTLGRFMQADPIGYADGMNWYNYAGGDPVNGSDPTGLAECPYCLPPISLPGGTSQPDGNSGPSYGPPDNSGRWDFGGQSALSALLRNRPVLTYGAAVPASQNDDEIVVTAKKYGAKALQCALDHFGISDLLDAGTAALGIPQEGSKPFVTPGSSKGTSALSEGLARRFPQRIGDTRIGQALGMKRIWTPRLGQLNRATPVVGRALGRLIPVAGAALLAIDAIEIGACTLSD